MRHLHFKKIKELEDKVTERAEFQTSVCLASEAPLVKPEPDFQLSVIHILIRAGFSGVLSIPVWDG